LNSLAEFTTAWQDTPEAHQRMLDAFTALYEDDPALKAHREWVKANDAGCGDDSFHAFWKMLVQEMPADFRFLEIGVYRGQTTSLIGMLAGLSGKRGRVVGISPFDGRGMVWPFTSADLPEGKCRDLELTWRSWCKWESHKDEGPVPTFITFETESCHQGTIDEAKRRSPFDIIYIDGLHTHEAVQQDLANYMPMVKVGGFLVCDDAAWSLKLPPNWFFGFEGASKAVDEVLPPFTGNEYWAHCGSLVHLRVFRRIK
jgi:predicted O-methyltransferase YrrM